MGDLRRQDAESRRRALDVTCSFIVQAPAGSGKTELLTQRFLALLATVERPEAVLAITFTRKAAAEMRNRILEALRTTALGIPDERILAETRELARPVLARDAQCGWNLLGNPSRLKLQTIDSLNQGLARRLPVLSGLGAGLGVEEQPDGLYRLAAERLLAHLPRANEDSGRAVGLLLTHLDNNPAKFVSLVAEMLGRRESWLAELPGDVGKGAAEAATRAVLEVAREALVRGHLRALQAAIPGPLLTDASRLAHGAAAHLVAAGTESPISKWQDDARPPAADLRDIARWRGLAEFLLTKDGELRRAFNKNQGIPAGQAQLKRDALGVLADLASHEAAVPLLDAVRRLPDPAYADLEWEVLKALFRVLRLAVAELHVVFAERGVADYPQFASAARYALGTVDEPTDTALALDAALRHVLVDEFQDTSDAQVQLLEQLTAGWQPGDGRTVFLVGDPMQSIYRFRHAEVGLFLNVRRRGLSGDGVAIELEPLTLSVNFRSTEPIVAWVNDCFRQVFPARDDDVRGAVTYAPSVTRPGAGSDGGVRVHAFLRRSRLLEAQRVADIVEQRLAASKEGQVAVLVQGRNHLVNVVAELARRGVAFQATDIDPLGQRPAVLDALALTRALAHLADRPSWLSALRAPWCGLTLAELHALVGDDLDAVVIDLLREPERRERLAPASQQRLERVLSVLEQALVEARRLGLRDTVERAWVALGGPATLGSERELDEVEAYFEELGAVEQGSAGALDFTLLAEALGRLYAPSRPQSGIRVELLTIHKAKGLQYDTVIVPGLDRRGRADAKRLLQWTKLPDRPEANLIVAPVQRVGDEPSALYAWLADLEAQRLRHERRRLLYVAATRAVRSLHLLGSCRVIDKDGALQLGTPGEDTALGILWPVVRSEFERRLAEAGDVTGEADVGPMRDPPLRRLPDDWRLPAPPRAPRIETVVNPRRVDTEVVEFRWARETARHVGTVVHRELQRLTRGEPGPAPGDARSLARFATELAELGVPGELRNDAAARVQNAVLQTLADERGRWLLDGSHRAGASELALTGRIGDEIVSVAIDRTFIDAAGVRWIVDYKTGPHEGGGLEQFLDEEQERYRPQLQRYAALVRHLGPEPIRLALYFPLLRGWREWAP